MQARKIAKTEISLLTRDHKTRLMSNETEKYK